MSPPNPWQQPPPVRYPPPARPWWHWAKAWWLVLVMPLGQAGLTLLDEATLLATTEPAMARILSPEEAERIGAIRDLRIPGGQLAQVGLLYTRQDAREVATSVLPVHLNLAAREDGRVAIRYDPTRNRMPPVIRSAMGSAWRIGLSLLAIWILLPACIRATRGEPNGWRLYRPWPFSR